MEGGGITWFTHRLTHTLTHTFTHWSRTHWFNHVFMHSLFHVFFHWLIHWYTHTPTLSHFVWHTNTLIYWQSDLGPSLTTLEFAYDHFSTTLRPHNDHFMTTLWAAAKRSPSGGQPFWEMLVAWRLPLLNRQPPCDLRSQRPVADQSLTAARKEWDFQSPNARGPMVFNFCHNF